MLRLNGLNRLDLSTGKRTAMIGFTLTPLPLGCGVILMDLAIYNGVLIPHNVDWRNFNAKKGDQQWRSFIFLSDLL